jgi:hypothetical protein
LRDEQLAERALHESAGHDHGRIDSQAADHGGCHEPADACQVQAALAVPVAEAAADDQERPDRELVAGTQPLDQQFAPADVTDNGRRRDVGDLRVHQVQHARDEDDGQRMPRSRGVSRDGSPAFPGPAAVIEELSCSEPAAIGYLRRCAAGQAWHPRHACFQADLRPQPPHEQGEPAITR